MGRYRQGREGWGWVGSRLAPEAVPHGRMTLPHLLDWVPPWLSGLTAAQSADDPRTPPRRWREGDTAVPVSVSRARSCKGGSGGRGGSSRHTIGSRLARLVEGGGCGIGLHPPEVSGPAVLPRPYLLFPPPTPPPPPRQCIPVASLQHNLSRASPCRSRLAHSPLCLRSCCSPCYCLHVGPHICVFWLHHPAARCFMYHPDGPPCSCLPPGSFCQCRISARPSLFLHASVFLMTTPCLCLLARIFFLHPPA